MSKLENDLDFQLQACGLSGYVREFRFHPTRRFLADFSWVSQRLIVEVQGGIWKGKYGGHSSGKGLMRDHEKHNLAVLSGFRILYANRKTIENGEAVTQIEEALKC